MDSETEAAFWERLNRLQARLKNEHQQSHRRISQHPVPAPQHSQRALPRGAVPRPTNRDAVIDSLAGQLHVLEAQQRELVQRIERLRPPPAHLARAIPRTHTDTSQQLSQLMISSMQHQQAQMIELLRSGPERRQHASPVRSHAILSVPPPSYPPVAHGGIPQGVPCQLCHHPAPCYPAMYPQHPMQYPGHQPVQHPGHQPMQHPGHQPMQHPGHRMPDLTQAQPLSIPPVNRRPKSQRTPENEEDHSKEPADSERRPSIGAAKRFRKAIVAVTALCHWRRYPPWIREWRGERRDSLQQKIKRSLPSARHYIFRKESQIRQALKSVMQKDAVPLKVSFPSPETRQAYNLLSTATESIVKEICSMKPSSPGLSQRIPRCISLLLQPENTVFPSDYLWPVEKANLSVDRFDVLKAVEPGGSEIVLLGFVFGRALLTAGLCSPLECGIVDSGLEGKPRENFQVLVTVLYHILRLAFASLLQQPGSARSASNVDPAPVDPDITKQCPLLLPDEDVKVHVKKLDRLHHALQEQLVEWARAFVAQLKTESRPATLGS